MTITSLARQAGRRYRQFSGLASALLQAFSGRGSTVSPTPPTTMFVSWNAEPTTFVSYAANASFRSWNAEPTTFVSYAANATFRSWNAITTTFKSWSSS